MNGIRNCEVLSLEHRVSNPELVINPIEIKVCLNPTLWIAKGSTRPVDMYLDIRD